jgi:hypothetical protein
MKVRFDQSGGFAGLLKSCELDTAHLPLEQGKELLKLIGASAIKASGEFLFQFEPRSSSVRNHDRRRAVETCGGLRRRESSRRRQAAHRLSEEMR